jgi:hypothetical protein
MQNASSFILRFWTLASTVSLVASASCGGGQHVANTTPPPTGPEEVSFEAATIRPSDTAAPASEAPAGAAPLAVAARHALDERHAAVAQCYATLLRTSAEAVGRLAVDLHIGPDGRVERVNARTEGEGGIGNARVCVENALRAVRMTDVPSNGVRIRRSYSFVNPPVEITVSDPVVVNAPHRSAPARAPTAAASAAPTSGSSAPPVEGDTGPLTQAEVTPFFAAHTPDLATCYATALRTARTAAGNATLDLTVGGDGAVSAAQLQSDAPALASMNECVATAARAWHFRASGTGATIHVPLAFAR